MMLSLLITLISAVESQSYDIKWSRQFFPNSIRSRESAFGGYNANTDSILLITGRSWNVTRYGYDEQEIYQVSTYNPTTNEFSKLSVTSSLSTDRDDRACQFSTIIDNTAYYFDGAYDDPYSIILNMDTNTFSSLNINFTFAEGGCVTSYNSKIYLAGGEYSLSLTVYDPSQETLTSLSNLPSRRLYASCAVKDNFLYLFGGSVDGYGSYPSNTILRYDIGSDTWEELAEPTFKSDTRGSQAILYKDDILIIPYYPDNIYPIVFDPTALTVRYLENALNVFGRGGKSVVTSNGTHVFVFGGDHNYGADTSYEIGTYVEIVEDTEDNDDAYENNDTNDEENGDGDDDEDTEEESGANPAIWSSFTMFVIVFVSMIL